MSETMLVTGGAGFIGSHLVDRLLADGHRVRVLDDLSTGSTTNLDPRAELVVADISDIGRLLDGVSGIFHLAAIASVARGNEDWPGTHRVNQSGSVAVFDAARAAGRLPVVYASSAAIYGDVGAQAADETMTPSPATAYGADKFGSELHGRIATSIHGVPTLGLRFFNVYGPRQDPSSPYSGVISIFARRIAAGEAVVLHGDGGQTRDFVHVSDIVAHLTAAMRHLRDGAGGIALNVCTGRDVSVRELALKLAQSIGVTPRLDAGPPRPGDIRHSRGNPKLASATLGVSAMVALEEGLGTLA